MKIKKVNSIKSLLKECYFFPIGFGTTATVYKMKNNKVLKLFNKSNHANQLLNSKDDIISHFEIISNISNDTFIGPEELVICDEKCIGYIYDVIFGKTFKSVNVHMGFDEMFKNYNQLINDTIDISNNEFLLGDLHDKNIIISDYFKIIDLDWGITNCKYNTFERNMKGINQTIIYSLFNVNYNDLITFYDKELNDIYNDCCLNHYDRIIELFARLYKMGYKDKQDTLIYKGRLIKTKENEYIR